MGRFENRFISSGVGPRPTQKLSYAKKIANDYDWAKKCIDYYGGSYSQTEFTNNQKATNKRWDWFNSIFDLEDFEKTVNPLNSVKSQFKEWSADLRPFNIMRPVIERIASEYRKRPFGYSVDVNDPESVTKFEQELAAEFLDNSRQDFANRVNELTGSEEATGIPTQQIESREKIKEAKLNLRDSRAVVGQNALELILSETYAKELFNDGILDWLINGDVVTLKEVENETIRYRKLSSLSCGWDRTTEYIEDGEYCWSIVNKPLTWVIEKFYDELTEKDIDHLTTDNKYNYNKTIYKINDTSSYDVNVMHVTWKSFKKIGILYYYDEETGELSEMEIPEEYKPSKDEIVEWMWIPEVWEGYRLNDDLFVRIRPIPEQRRLLDHRGVCKLPYNGRIYSGTYTNKVSIASLSIPYQILFLVGMRQLELCLSKNKGKVILMDKNVIPNDREEGWDEEKFMYYGQALGYLFIDRNQQGVDKSYNQYQVLNASTMDEVAALIQFITWVEQQYKNIFGITPQREGQFSPKEGTGQRELDLMQSAVISEEVFARYDEFVQRELQGLLDYSKYCWRNGKQALFKGSDLRNKILSLDPEQHASLSYGVKVEVDGRTLDVLKRMQQASFAFAQNGSTPSSILEILDAQNPSMIKEALKKMEMMDAQREENLAKQQEESAIAIERSKQESLQQEHENDLDKINLEYDRKIELETIKQAIVPEPPVQEREIDNSLQIKQEENATKKEIESNKLNHEAQMKGLDMLNNQAERLNKREIENIKLKNPVVGEKSK